ncbi:MAG: hypothetical protein H0U71_08050 [Gammaproteobacteria bacterium]|nr:hypothetical protein [Gammaproteobacteria bacterium]
MEEKKTALSKITSKNKKRKSREDYANDLDNLFPDSSNLNLTTELDNSDSYFYINPQSHEQLSDIDEEDSRISEFPQKDVGIEAYMLPFQNKLDEKIHAALASSASANLTIICTTRDEAKKLQEYLNNDRKLQITRKVSVTVHNKSVIIPAKQVFHINQWINTKDIITTFLNAKDWSSIFSKLMQQYKTPKQKLSLETTQLLLEQYSLELQPLIKGSEHEQYKIAHDESVTRLQQAIRTSESKSLRRKTVQENLGTQDIKEIQTQHSNSTITNENANTHYSEHPFSFYRENSRLSQSEHNTNSVEQTQKQAHPCAEIYLGIREKWHAILILSDILKLTPEERVKPQPFTALKNMEGLKAEHDRLDKILTDLKSQECIIEDLSPSLTL